MVLVCIDAQVTCSKGTLRADSFLFLLLLETKLSSAVEDILSKTFIIALYFNMHRSAILIEGNMNGSSFL